ncbi:MAG: hypothetical protein J0H99_17950, partial [Rhodospirillales bacterium]|nr:hypothetical protein [Rhodospirillales bacterium]
MPEVVHPKTSDAGRNPGAVALSIAAMMRVFGNGEMAALRRLDDNPAVPAYWRLAARHPILSERNTEERHRAWRAIVQALAILTPKGLPGERGDLHDPERKLGATLCDGGSRDWPGGLAPGTSPRPMISE